MSTTFWTCSAIARTLFVARHWVEARDLARRVLCADPPQSAAWESRDAELEPAALAEVNPGTRVVTDEGEHLVTPSKDITSTGSTRERNGHAVQLSIDSTSADGLHVNGGHGCRVRAAPHIPPSRAWAIREEPRTLADVADRDGAYGEREKEIVRRHMSGLAGVISGVVRDRGRK